MVCSLGGGRGGVLLLKRAGGSWLNAALGNLACESRAGGNSLHVARDGFLLPGANPAYGFWVCMSRRGWGFDSSCSFVFARSAVGEPET